MKHAHLYSLALAALALLPIASADDKKPAKDDSIMKKKLATAQKLLGGIALNDFDSIKDSADRLNDYSKQAAWKLMESPRYEVYSDEFQRITLKMSAQAAAKNLDGVTLAYVDMTLVCVKCHQHVREQKIGMNPPLSLPNSGLGR
jgi:hypothetical protein